MRVSLDDGRGDRPRRGQRTRFRQGSGARPSGSRSPNRSASPTRPISESRSPEAPTRSRSTSRRTARFRSPPKRADGFFSSVGSPIRAGHRLQKRAPVTRRASRRPAPSRLLLERLDIIGGVGRGRGGAGCEGRVHPQEDQKPMAGHGEGASQREETRPGGGRTPLKVEL